RHPHHDPGVPDHPGPARHPGRPDRHHVGGHGAPVRGDTMSIFHRKHPETATTTMPATTATPMQDGRCTVVTVKGSQCTFPERANELCAPPVVLSLRT